MMERQSLPEFESSPSAKFLETLDSTWNLLSRICSNPLFSSIVTLFTIIHLYLPPILVGILLSPITILTGTLLIAILRLGAAQAVANESKSKPIKRQEESESKTDACDLAGSQPALRTGIELEKNPISALSFVEWDVRAPLEIIYEENEDAGEENDGVLAETSRAGIVRSESFSRYYPESDSESSSDGELPGSDPWSLVENVGFQWEEEEREVLIELALVANGRRSREFQIDEDNLIEIDISPV